MDTNLYLQFAQQYLGGPFNDLQLLITAFTHRSYINEHKKTAQEHNERLEFLGDAVLELSVTRFLYTNHTDPEGILTNWRSALVRTESIGGAAARLEIEPLLRLSRGEKRGSDRAREQILANCYEAIVGALYLDQGFEAADEFIKRSLLVTFEEILKTGSWMDPKSRLQEFAQSKEGATPVYRLIKEDGPDHDKTFLVGVYLNEEMLGQGSGPSKQAAQVDAATNALKSFK